MSPSSQSIEDRCENWGAWARGHTRFQKRTAKSAEGHWRSPQMWEAAPATAWMTTDAGDAQAIESAVCALPLYYHALLRGWYVGGPRGLMSAGECLLRASQASGEPRARLGTFVMRLHAGHALLIAALAVPAVVRKQRAREIVREALERG
jgi:hypothetical protein